MNKEWLSRLRLVFHGQPRHELDEELQFHIDRSVDRNIASGMTPREARRHATIEFGAIERTRAQLHEQRPGWWLGTVAQDIRYALRGFGRNPVFTIAVIATLAVGIGATTAVFSVVDRILFRGLPYAHDDRLVSLGLTQSLEKQEFTLGGFFFEWRDNQKPFEAVTFETGYGDCNLTDANPIHLQCISIAQNFLPVLGIVPVAGRNFTPEEDVPNGPRVAMISDGLWRARFNRDPAVIEKTLNVDGHATRIVGVLPKDFVLPRLQTVDILRPAQINIAEQHTVNSGIGYPMWAFARLKPGVSVAEARAQMEPLYLHTQEWIPAQIRKDFHLQVRSLRDRQMQDAYTVAWVLLGSVLAVLMIACANVASLFSARGASRERELAVRSALGASRGRLTRQTLTEAFLLAAAGAVAGTVLAEILLRVFIAIAPTGVPFLADARLDLRIVLFTVLISLSCAALFGVLPALEKPRTTSLTGRQSKSTAHARLRHTLVAMQIAVSIVLLCGASLLLKSFYKLEQQDLGMQTRNVLTVHVPLNEELYSAGTMNFYLRAEAALRHIPGVTAVGMTDSLPPDGWHGGTRYSEIRIVARPPTSPGIGGTVTVRKVTPDYFRVLQIPIVEGVGFTEEERSSKQEFVILSQDLADRLFPQHDAIGQHFDEAQYTPYYAPGPICTVVGVAGNVKNEGLAQQEDPELYNLAADRPDTWGRHHFFVLETNLPASIIAPWIRSQIAQIDPTAPAEIASFGETVNRLSDRPRFETALLGFFAVCGLLLAAIGLYGIMAFMAAQRTQEIGVRMALGATRAHILRLILGEGMRLVVAGGCVGVCASFAASQVLKSLLFNTRPHDPFTYIAVASLLGLVAIAATLIPARRAMKVEPVVALRYE